MRLSGLITYLSAMAQGDCFQKSPRPQQSWNWQLLNSLFLPPGPEATMPFALALPVSLAPVPPPPRVPHTEHIIIGTAKSPSVIFSWSPTSKPPPPRSLQSFD